MKLFFGGGRGGGLWTLFQTPILCMIPSLCLASNNGLWTFAKLRRAKKTLKVRNISGQNCTNSLTWKARRYWDWDTSPYHDSSEVTMYQWVPASSHWASASTVGILATQLWISWYGHGSNHVKTIALGLTWPSPSTKIWWVEFAIYMFGAYEEYLWYEFHNIANNIASNRFCFETHWIPDRTW